MLCDSSLWPKEKRVSCYSNSKELFYVSFSVLCHINLSSNVRHPGLYDELGYEPMLKIIYVM